MFLLKLTYINLEGSFPGPEIFFPLAPIPSGRRCKFGGGCWLFFNNSHREKLWE